ncbi:hypothetical protein VTN02DRAFT_2654 [Thermoascus thermophilus]
MPPKRKAASKISGPVDSDGEDVMQIAHEEPAAEPPVKKARGRPKSAPPKVAKEKNPAAKVRTPAATAPKQDAPPKKPAGRGRPKRVRTLPLEPEAEPRADADVEGEAGHDGSAEEEALRTQPEASNDELESPKNVAKPKRPGRPPGTRGRKRSSSMKDVRTDGEFEYTPSAPKHTEFADNSENEAKRPGRRKAEPKESYAIPESDRSMPEVEESILPEEQPASTQTKPVSSSPLKSRANGYAASRGAQDTNRRRGPGAASDTREIGEPELRRKLGDLTKRYESLEAKFRDLREIGIVEANANAEKMRKQCEAATAASDELIESLKKELSAQKALGQQSKTLQKKLKERDTEVGNLESKIEKLSSQLSSAQTEIKTLQNKLAAARNASANVESIAMKPPGSAVKNNGVNRAALAAASAEAAQAVQIGQLKEDLYSDLTGLIIRDVKKRESDHLYDCIQTGVNGTLHFKLAVANNSDGKTTTSFEQAEFHYVPLLDENRDRDLMDLLPDYLTVDITFSRQQASKFYNRVIDTLTKRRVDPAD